MRLIRSESFPQLLIPLLLVVFLWITNLDVGNGEKIRRQLRKHEINQTTEKGVPECLSHSQKVFPVAHYSWRAPQHAECIKFQEMYKFVNFNGIFLVLWHSFLVGELLYTVYRLLYAKRPT